MTVKLDILLFLIGLGTLGLILLQITAVSYVEGYIKELDEQVKAKVPYLIVSTRAVFLIGLLNGCLAAAAFWSWSASVS